MKYKRREERWQVITYQVNSSCCKSVQNISHPSYAPLCYFEHCLHILSDQLSRIRSDDFLYQVPWDVVHCTMRCRRRLLLQCTNNISCAFTIGPELQLIPTTWTSVAAAQHASHAVLFCSNWNTFTSFELQPRASNPMMVRLNCYPYRLMLLVGDRMEVS